MKNISIIITGIILLSFCESYAQEGFQKNKINQFVNYYPTKQESITIFDKLDAKYITLISPIEFTKIELLDSRTNKIVYICDRKGKIATICKLNLEKGVYILQIYTENLILTAELHLEFIKENTNNNVA